MKQFCFLLRIDSFLLSGGLGTAAFSPGSRFFDVCFAAMIKHSYCSPGAVRRTLITPNQGNVSIISFFIRLVTMYTIFCLFAFAIFSIRIYQGMQFFKGFPDAAHFVDNALLYGFPAH